MNFDELYGYLREIDKKIKNEELDLITSLISLECLKSIIFKNSPLSNNINS